LKDGREEVGGGDRKERKRGGGKGEGGETGQPTSSNENLVQKHSRKNGKKKKGKRGKGETLFPSLPARRRREEKKKKKGGGKVMEISRSPIGIRSR